MDRTVTSRRHFLASGGAMSAGLWLRLAGPGAAALAQAACTARDEQAPFKTLGEREAAGLAAIAARIIPTTDTPGAGEAGVIHYFDQALGTAILERQALLGGLAEFDAALAARHPGVAAFADLAPEAQDAFLGEREGSVFFETVRIMTIFGFFAMSRYGGNRDHVAWKLIGFEGHHGAWSYPFGHYDAAASDGE